MTVDAQLRVDGVWLSAARLPYSDLQWTDRVDGGNYECTWDMDIPYGSRPSPLVRGALAEVYLGASRRFYGEVTDTDWAGGQFTATGMSQRAYDFAARTLGVATSTVPDTVIDTSIVSDGWRVTRPTSIGAVAAASDATNISSVGAVLDQAALDAGTHWGVWGDGAVRLTSTPFLYDYLLAPGVIELGETTEDTFTRVVYQYLNVDTGQVQLDAVGSNVPPVRHTFQDFTSKGPVTGAVAAAIAQNQLNLGLSSQGWTTSVEVTSAQLLTPGGLPADLASVTAGQMVRASVFVGAGQAFRDLVIGETKYLAGTDSISLAPVGKVATSLSEVLEDTYARLTGTAPVAS